MLHLILSIKDVPVIQWRHKRQPKKYEFADKIIKEWGLERHDYQPSFIDIMCLDDKIDVITWRDMGDNGLMYVAIELHKPNGNGFDCAYLDFIQQERIPSYDYNWDLTFIGNKSSDVDSILGAVPIKSKISKLGNTNLYCPIRDWTDEDIWGYTEEYNVPYNDKRYDKSNGYKEFKDKTYNENYHFCCTECVNPNSEEIVTCPITKKERMNIGNEMQYPEKLKTYKEMMSYIDFKEV